MFIATTKKEYATLAWYIINIIVLVCFLRRQYNQDRDVNNIFEKNLIIITYIIINQITTINYLHNKQNLTT